MTQPISPNLRDLAARAARTERRLRTVQALRFAAFGAIPTLTCIAGAVLHQKLTHGYRAGLGWKVIVISAGVSAAATLAAVVYASVRRYPKHAAALLLDRTFDNHDRLATALSFSELPADARTPLMNAAIDDATQTSTRLDPAVAAPLSPAFKNPDLFAALGMAALVVALTQLQWAKTIVRPAALTIDAVSLTADDIELFRETLRELDAKDSTPETKEALQAFNQLVQDLADKRLDRAEAFRRMEALEKGLLKGREADQKALEEALKHAALRLKDSPLSKPAGEALEKRDLQKAEAELKELAKKLRDKQSKISEAEKKRLKEAIAAAARSQKETLKKLMDQREQLRASLLAREQKAGQSDEEKRLLQRDKRELDRLDREIAQKEKAGRELDRLDRELSKAAEDLLRDLGLSADDLDRAAEDINRMAREELSEKEKEELRQRLQELRELLRQEGKGGEEMKKRLRKFAKKAKGKGGNEGEQGDGKKGQKKDTGDGEGEEGEDDDGEDGEDGEDGKKPGQKKGQGQEGEGEGEGEGKGKGKGKKAFVLKRGSGSGSGQPGTSPGDGPGQGQPGGSQPGGQGTEPGGKQAGTGHDANLTGKATHGKFGTHDVEAAATDTGQGPSVSETILSSSEKGFVGKKYKRVYADYKTKAEEAMKAEDIPPGYKFYVQRYFQLIRPRE